MHLFVYSLLTAALLLIRFQLVHDMLQELTLLLWKITVMFHPNKERQDGLCGEVNFFMSF